MQPATANALLLSGNESYGTPAPYIELARYVLGRIDLDPASDGYWNYHLVKASTFYDEQADGLRRTWFGNVFLNGPSNREAGIYIRPWWERLFTMWSLGEVDAAIWLGFALPQLTTLQGCAGHPLQFVNLFPRERIDFMVRAPGNGPPTAAGQPTHSNYITLLPVRGEGARPMLSRFVEASSDLKIGGALVRPL